MELRSDIISELLKNINISLLSFRFSARDNEYEYILDGIEFYQVRGERYDNMLLVVNSTLARFFMYDFIPNSIPENFGESVHLHYLRESLIKKFIKADKDGYRIFNKKLLKLVSPYKKSDERVTQAIWKMYNNYYQKNDRVELTPEFVKLAGRNNGLIRRIAEVIQEQPGLYFEFPQLLIKHKAIDLTKDYYFKDTFWSLASYKEALQHLSEEFLSVDGQSWNYRQKGNKTVFIALFEEMYVKDYLKKRLSSQEIKNIALNSFGIDISDRTFNEASAIIKARNLFKFLPVHIRYVGNDEEYNEHYKRR